MTDWKAPCVLCGYNGPRFYEPTMHRCMAHGSERNALLAEIARLKAEVRVLKQRLDCTYGDTPGLIHCPPDQPCAMHEAERLMSTTDKRPAPTSDFCVSCDTHLSEFCWVCHGKMEKQRDDLLAACEALMALEWWANEQTGAVEADGRDKVYAQARAAIDVIAAYSGQPSKE